MGVLWSKFWYTNNQNRNDPSILPQFSTNQNHNDNTILPQNICVELIDSVQSNLNYNLAQNPGIGSGGYKWTVPTSIFLGFRPTNLQGKTEYETKDDRGRIVLKVEVFNIVEKRFQTEDIRQDKFTGVVLRGHDNLGWASRKLSDVKSGWGPDIHFQVFGNSTQGEFQGEKIQATQMKEESFWNSTMSCMKQHFQQSCGDQKAFFDKDHAEQLLEHSESLVNLLQEAFAPFALPEVNYEMLIGTFGGGAKRYAVTYDVLRELALSYGHVKENDTLNIHEMWGEGLVRFGEKEDVLVGYEIMQDGKKKYVRLAVGDVSSDVQYASYQCEGN